MRKYKLEEIKIEEIINKLEELGAIVKYYDERPANNNFIKGLIRINKNIVKKKIDSYYRKILNEISGKKFDYFFLNRGEVVPEFFLQELKASQFDCQFILNTWDSFANQSHPIKILKYFDKKFTFDPKDAIEYKIHFRPLFYLDSFKNLINLEKEFDILFLGTAHSDRYKIGSIVKKWAAENKLKTYFYYFMHGRIVFFYKKIFDKIFSDFKYKELSFKSLNISDITKLYQVSNVILDINHPNQNGLTMRTFEAIGAKKKLITTNRDISKYPFYNENNIFIIDREFINLDSNFFENDYIDMNPDLYEKFSINGWIYNLFVDAEPDFWNLNT
jgi:hypothetical protein